MPYNQMKGMILAEIIGNVRLISFCLKYLFLQSTFYQVLFVYLFY